MSNATDELKATIVNIASKLVLESHRDRTDRKKEDEELKLLTDKVIQTYKRILGEVTK